MGDSLFPKLDRIGLCFYNNYDEYMAETVDLIYYPDKAIQSNTLDRFNFNPTAEILAQNISKLSAKDSYTIAVNGAWGSGKSSFLNLVRHHLENSVEHKHIVFIDMFH